VFKLLNLPKNKVIVDIGSGKGRVLLMASEFGFKEARGVEFSLNLCEIAKKNIENYTAKKKTNTIFNVYNADARFYQ
jgi:tRNA1(Val) A37 N6-methylase TrmN6